MYIYIVRIALVLASLFYLVLSNGTTERNIEFTKRDRSPLCPDSGGDSYIIGFPSYGCTGNAYESRLIPLGGCLSGTPQNPKQGGLGKSLLVCNGFGQPIAKYNYYVHHECREEGSAPGGGVWDVKINGGNSRCISADSIDQTSILSIIQELNYE